MGLTRYEQETVINYNNDESTMQIYTADPALMRRLKKLPAYELVEVSRQDGKVIAMTFRADKRLLTLRSQVPVSHMTDEQKEAAAKRLRELRNK